MNDKACTGKVVGFNCSANANPGVTSYQLFENETAILNTSASGMWWKILESEGIFVYKCVANTSLGVEYSMGVTVTLNGKQKKSKLCLFENNLKNCAHKNSIYMSVQTLDYKKL